MWRVYPVGDAMTHTGERGSGLPKPRWKVLCRGLHGTGVEIALSLTIPLGKQGRTPLYVGLPSAWGSVDGVIMFSQFLGGLLFGGTLADINE